MGKFDGILLCTDLDDTLLTSDKRVSEKNIEAIEYFKSEGGLFTFVTGRVPLGALPVLEYIMPNAPAVCFNGGGIYDFENKKTLWLHPLDEGAAEAAEYVDRAFPSAGIEVCTADAVYFPKATYLTERHKVMERFPENYDGIREIKEAWSKVIFMVEPEEMDALRETIEKSPYGGKYTFVRSSLRYFEMLPKGINKGAGLKKLSQMLDIDPLRVIAMGDNENDLEMIHSAGVGIAVENAVAAVKNAADYITVHHDNDAVSSVISDIENGLI